MWNQRYNAKLAYTTKAQCRMYIIEGVSARRSSETRSASRALPGRPWVHSLAHCIPSNVRGGARSIQCISNCIMTRLSRV